MKKFLQQNFYLSLTNSCVNVYDFSFWTTWKMMSTKVNITSLCGGLILRMWLPLMSTEQSRCVLKTVALPGSIRGGGGMSTARPVAVLLKY